MATTRSRSLSVPTHVHKSSIPYTKGSCLVFTQGSSPHPWVPLRRMRKGLKLAPPHTLDTGVGCPTRKEEFQQSRCVAAPVSLKSERNCTDLKGTINHAARRPTATALTTVLALCVSDAGGPPTSSREAPRTDANINLSLRMYAARGQSGGRSHATHAIPRCKPLNCSTYRDPMQRSTMI